MRVAARPGIMAVVATMLAIAFALFFFAGPAVAAGTEASSDASPTSSPTPAGVSVVDAHTVAIDQDGFSPSEDVEVTLHSDPIMLGTLTADSEGRIRGTFEIPVEVPLDTHEVWMHGKESGVVMTKPIQIGFFDPTWLIIGVVAGLIVLGLAGILVFRRRAAS